MLSRTALCLTFLALLTLPMSAPASAQVLFNVMEPPSHPVFGTLRETDTPYFRSSVSADGGTVVGTAWRDLFGAPSIVYRWRRGIGMEVIPPIPGDPGRNTRAYGVSSDGETIAMDNGLTGAGYYSYRGGSYDHIGLDTEVRAISSPDGRWIGGVLSGPLTAFRWSADTGIQDIGGLPGADETDAEDISPDGEVVVGRSFGGVEQAFIWTPAHGMMNLGSVIGATRSDAVQVSADGNSILLNATFPNETARSFVWDRSSGVLASLAEFSAVGANSDFSVLHNFSSIWTQGTGAINVLDLLVQSGTVPAGFRLDGVSAIAAAADPFGLVTVTGNGRNEFGFQRGWVATFTIPTPAGAVLFSVTGACVALRRRR